MKNYLQPLISEGSETFVSNVKCRMYAVQLGECILPLTVTETAYENSYVASNYYPIARIQEWLKSRHPSLYHLLRPFTFVLAFFFKRVKINQMVMVNNWLFSTNLFPQISGTQIQEITKMLVKTFPQHVIVFRNINTLLGSGLYQSLQKAGYFLAGTRAVYIYNPEKRQELSAKALSHHRRDFRLLKKFGYEVLRREEIGSGDIPRILELYKMIYVEKHTRYSPQYTPHFIETAILSGFMDLVVIKKDGKIDGVFGCVQEGNIMNAPFLGYDVTLGHSGEIYRMLTILILKEAEIRKCILNDSSGASKPKKYRGLKPHLEYTATYAAHLPLGRRLFWAVAGRFYHYLIFPFVANGAKGTI